jgi:hypothetical protein
MTTEPAGELMAAANIKVSETPMVLYVLRRADDALILASSTAMPPRSRARTTTKTGSPICATSGNTAICC